MSLRRNNKPAPEVMTWGRASPILAVAAVSDALRLFFGMFWFFGPALAAAYCVAETTDVAVIGGLLSTACAVVAAKTGVLLSASLTTFGTVMDMAIGLFGWLAVGLWLIRTNPRIFKENTGHTVWFVGSLLVSEVPIIGTVPALSVTMWRLYHEQIKKEKQDMKRYESENATALQEEKRQQTEQFMRINAAKLEQDEIAREEETATEQALAEIPEEMSGAR